METCRVLLIAALVVFALAAPAGADDSRLGGEPGNVHVVTSDDIRMEAETVQAVMYGRFAEYVVDFQFVNSGPLQVVRLGFPFGLDQRDGQEQPVALAGFQAFHEEDPLDVTPVTGTDGPRSTGWFEHQATFPTGRSTVRVRYLTRPSASAGLPDEASETAPPQYAGMSGSTAWYPYTLHTGAGWAGTIGRAVIRYSLSEDLEGWGFGSDPYPGFRSAPAGYSWPDSRTMQWIIEDFEPTQSPETGESPYDVAAYYYLPGYSPAEWDQEARADWAKPPEAEVSASSVSSAKQPGFPEQPLSPEPAAADGDPSTAWVSRTGRAVDEQLELVFHNRRSVREIRIVPGFARTPEDYAAHGRPKTIEARFDDGTVETLALADEPTVQRFSTNADSNRVVLRVTAVYPGKDFDDVALTEVELGSATAPKFWTFEQAIAASGPTVDLTEDSAPDPSPADDDPATGAVEPGANPKVGAWIGLVVGLALAVGTTITLRLRARRA